MRVFWEVACAVSLRFRLAEEHRIEWVSLKTKFGNQRKPLHPGDAPKVCFAVCEGNEVEAVFACCNVHFIWKG